MSYYKVKEIDSRTWQIEDPFDTYCYLLAGEYRAVLIDTCNGLPGLPELVLSLIKKPVTVFLTHGHSDHTAAASDFPETYIDEKDSSILAEGFDSAKKPSTLLHYEKLFSVNLDESARKYYCSVKGPEKICYFHGGDTFDLGGRELEIIETPAHTRGSVCILDHTECMLFSGDTVCDNEILVYFPHSTTVEDVERSNQKLIDRQFEFNTIWPGHHRSPLTISICKDYVQAAKDLLSGRCVGKRIELEDGYKLLYQYRTIGISYLPGHIR